MGETKKKFIKFAEKIMHNGKPQVYGASETLAESKAFDRLIS